VLESFFPLLLPSSTKILPLGVVAEVTVLVLVSVMLLVVGVGADGVEGARLLLPLSFALESTAA
jgi:hypothetical protein